MGWLLSTSSSTLTKQNGHRTGGGHSDCWWSQRLLFPATLFSTAAAARIAAELVDKADQGEEQSNHNASHDNGQENYHDRFQQRGHSGHCVIHLVLVSVRD